MKEIYYSRERVNTFNDAIFSIAITLLVLEIDVPDGQFIMKHGIWNTLSSLVPSFIGFFVSFMVIAIYWIGHMKFARYIEKYDTHLLWLNIFLLLFTALLPFSTSFYVNSFNLREPFVFYCFNIIGLGVFNFLMIRRVVKTYPKKIDKAQGDWLKFRSINAIIVWTISLFLAFIFPFISRFFFILIFVFQAFGDRYFQKKGLNKLH